MRYGKRFASNIAGKLEMHACPKGQVMRGNPQVVAILTQAVNDAMDRLLNPPHEIEPAPPPVDSKKRAPRPLMVPFRAGSQGRVKC